MAAPHPRPERAALATRKRHHRGMVSAPSIKSLKLRGFETTEAAASAALGSGAGPLHQTSQGKPPRRRPLKNARFCGANSP